MENQIFYSNENEHLERQFEQIIQTISELIKTNPSNRNCLKDVQDNCKAQLRRITQLGIENAQSASYSSVITAPKGGVLNVRRCNALKPECNHEYVTDTIDITPEKSQQITYCVFCESTK